MVKSKKIYVVRKGREIGIFDTWGECQQQVKGYSGAEYKSFTDPIEADKYLKGTNSIISATKLQDDEMVAYVDGSYNSDTGEYGAGVVILYQSKKRNISRKGTDPILSKMNNIAGELLAAQAAMRYALQRKVATLIIYHDLEGTQKWFTGEWQATKKGTQDYQDFCNTVSKSLTVRFVKVVAHSGNEYNDEADKLARKAIGK
jgi:ribonuclease H-related protein